MPNPFTLPIPARRLLDRAPKGLFAFLSVGVSGLAAHTALFTLLYHFGADKRLAWLAALAVATTLTWTLNRRLTFTSSGRSRASEALRYILVTGVAQGVSFGVFMLAGRLVPSLPASLDVIAGAGVATLFSYTGQRYFTFAAPKIAPEVIAAELAYPGVAALPADAHLGAPDGAL